MNYFLEDICPTTPAELPESANASADVPENAPANVPPSQNESTSNISPKKLAANQANAKKSTGPKTPGGKHISSRNATTHGLLAKSVVLPGESVDRFNDLHRSYLNRFNPTEPDELDLVETMAVNRWRLRRAWSLESATFIHEQRAQASSTQGLDPVTQYATAHETLSKPPRSLESLSRYEVRCDRQYHRAADRLRRMLSEREKKETLTRTHRSEQNQELSTSCPPDRTTPEDPSNPAPNPSNPPLDPPETKDMLNNPDTPGL